ncbi:MULTISPECIES: sigma-70 family RNA polymerase sigma factor [Microvirga]|uniref:sigma-70 family RNA polymerase sigma factor n=1 Tax=Microvirga TaxID=186650 RepID=UPI001CFD9895|nr:sigma-70 family RNA polymerase sigma factor [Microvirga lenta]MCB5174197.1 sigma-70 family RNA polymerase sigma factor [Microvirga lenta]
MNEIEALIQPKIPALRRYAFALTRDNDLADDLVQDCLEHAVRRWHIRAADENLRAWLFAILHNVFISHVRYCSRRGAQVDFTCMEDPPSRDGVQERRLEVRDALSGLAQLPAEQRDVLLLVGVEEMSYAEAAQVLGIPIGTVMSRLSRGREGLRRILETGQAETLRSVK